MNKGAFSGKKDISPVAIPSIFLAIAKLFKYTTEFPSPADKRGWALSKLLVLGTIISLVGYSITFPGD